MDFESLAKLALDIVASCYHFQNNSSKQISQQIKQKRQTLPSPNPNCKQSPDSPSIAPSASLKWSSPFHNPFVRSSSSGHHLTALSNLGRNVAVGGRGAALIENIIVQVCKRVFCHDNASFKFPRVNIDQVCPFFYSQGTARRHTFCQDPLEEVGQLCRACGATYRVSGCDGRCVNSGVWVHGSACSTFNGGSSTIQQRFARHFYSSSKHSLVIQNNLLPLSLHGENNRRLAQMADQ